MKQLLSIFLFILVISCKKENKQNFPIKFYEDRVEIRSGLRMFTANGEVKDQEVIQNAAKETDVFNDEKIEAKRDRQALTLISADSAIFQGTNTRFSYTVNSGKFSFYLKWEHYLMPRWSPPLTNPDFLREMAPYIAYGDLKQLKLALKSEYRAFKSANEMYTASSTGYGEFDEKIVSTLKNGEYYLVKEYFLILKSGQ